MGLFTSSKELALLALCLYHRSHWSHCPSWRKNCPKGAVERRHPQAADVSCSFVSLSLVDSQNSHFSGSEAGIEGAVAVSERLGRQCRLLIGSMSCSSASICYPHPWPLWHPSLACTTQEKS
ncbi:hypothetical protein DER45DRAFT_401482 [Fusarium avenaceum]|nr:hypothetical protein DER45DRAFT_401482 [Fusarium avenaceum]